MSTLGFTPVSAALLAISLLSALAYLFVFLGRPESALKTLTKTAAIGALAVLALVDGAPWLLVLALALSAIGDLALSRDGESAFLMGLGAFLLAHLAYIPLFLDISGSLEGWRLAVVIALLIHAALTARWLWPHLGEMRLPVAFYVSAIAAMGVAAVGAPLALWPILIGAALFVASDTVLAAETFVFKAAPRRWTAPFIWTTYYAAQALIAAAWVCRAFENSAA